MWIGLLQALLSFAGHVAAMMRERGLMEAGHAQAVNEALDDALEAIRRAHDARRNAGTVGMPDDPNNRD